MKMEKLSFSVFILYSERSIDGVEKKKKGISDGEKANPIREVLLQELWGDLRFCYSRSNLESRVNSTYHRSDETLKTIRPNRDIHTEDGQT